jgi:hypothetical protein
MSSAPIRQRPETPVLSVTLSAFGLLSGIGTCVIGTLFFVISAHLGLSIPIVLAAPIFGMALGAIGRQLAAESVVARRLAVAALLVDAAILTMMLIAVLLLERHW